MLVSYNWLKEYVDLENVNPNDLASKLTAAGVEVESVTRLSNATNLCVGYVKTCELVPDTHLHLCDVDLGEKLGEKKIICGAPNVRKDLKVIVALPGAKLPGGEIKVSNIHGIDSNGMLCSLPELGVADKYISEEEKNGIHELPSDFPVGATDVLKRLGLDDIILNLKLLANRPDLMSLYNVAREVATILNCTIEPLKYKKYKGNKSDFFVDSKTNNCPQFAARIIKGIMVKESPNYIKERLIAMGVRPINNIVDIGNYVMLLTGQPLHMYDYDKLGKKELIAKDGFNQDFVAIDHNKYHIEESDICITSNDKIMCLGGVMGGENSLTDNATKNIVIEAANFQYSSIRRTSIRLNLVSESSNRFAHGINPNQYNDVLDFTTSLVEECSGMEEVSEIIVYDNNNYEAKKINATVKQINEILGTEFSLEKITDVLSRDHFVIENVHNDVFTCVVPDWRIDIVGVNDLAEEVIRILGFNDVNNELPKLKTEVGILNNTQKQISEIKRLLLYGGLYEVYTYVLVNKKRIDEFRILNSDVPYKLINPMTDDHEYVRPNLLPSLLDIVSYNLAHQNDNFGIFEISDININDKQSKFLSICLTGQDLYQGKVMKNPYNFYHAKGYFESITQSLGIEKSRYQIKPWNLDNNDMHPGKSALVYLGKNLIGYFGELHPNAYSRYGIKNHVVIGLELNLSLLLDTPVGNLKFKSLPIYPTVTRDLSLLCSKDLTSQTIIDIIKRNGGVLVKNVEVFDVYFDKLMPEKKSIAITITLYDEKGTLKDAAINETIEKVKAALLKENISIRV